MPQTWDHDQIAEEIGIDDLAANAARLTKITPSDTGPDEGQRKIITSMEKKLSALRQETATQLDHHKDRRFEAQNELDAIPRENLQGLVLGALDRTLTLRQDSLVGLRQVEQEKARNLRFFREYHGLKREAFYPASQLFNWALAITLLALESIGNAYFFANASDFGLIGGALQAAVISAINVFGSLAFGKKILPQLSYTRPEYARRRFWVKVAVWLYGVVLVLFNLLIAHYRVVLELDPKDAILLAFRHMWPNPLAIDNFDAWILLFVGIFFALVALADGYRMDDPFPGYGELDRDHKEALADYEDEKARTTKEAEAAMAAEKERLRRAVAEANRLSSGYSAAVTQSKNVMERFDTEVAGFPGQVEALLRRYRERYLAINDIAKPAYFEERYEPEPLAPLTQFDERKCGEQIIANDQLTKLVEKHRDDGLLREREIFKVARAHLNRFKASVDKGEVPNPFADTIATEPSGEHAAGDAAHEEG